MTCLSQTRFSRRSLEHPTICQLVDDLVTAIGLSAAEYGTHSLRRTKASISCRAMGNLRAIQINTPVGVECPVWYLKPPPQVLHTTA